MVNEEIHLQTEVSTPDPLELPEDCLLRICQKVWQYHQGAIFEEAAFVKNRHLPNNRVRTTLGCSACRARCEVIHQEWQVEEITEQEKRPSIGSCPALRRQQSSQ